MMHYGQQEFSSSGGVGTVAEHGSISLRTSIKTSNTTINVYVYLIIVMNIEDHDFSLYVYGG